VSAPDPTPAAGAEVLAFDEGMIDTLAALSRTRDMRRRRRLVRRALRAQPGERILDVGCGPGFYVEELCAEVGPGGCVAGVDISPHMLAAAARRMAGHANVAFHEGSAASLPVDAGTFDAALSVQVLEYIPDVTAALAELHRAVRPGGRVVVWDVDWETVSWFSADPARMARVLRAWDGHLVHRALPQTLVARMRSVGFEAVRLTGHAFTASDDSPHGYGGAILPLIEQYVGGRGGVSEDEAEAWSAEQRERARRGEFFFACLQFCATATRAAEPR
jgi:ubiquinone/menaquinone biosynthesis C-methylase UbiE